MKYGCSDKQWNDPVFLQQYAALLWQGSSDASGIYRRARELMGVEV